MSVDNRFLLADIAAALECPVTQLTGQSPVPTSPGAAAAEADVHAVRLALIETDLEEDPDAAPRPLPVLEQETDLVRDRWARCDYTGQWRLLPGLLRELHATASGPDREAALRLMAVASESAQVGLKDCGYPGEAWLAAERCRQAAETLDDPVLIGFAGFSRAVTASALGGYRRGLNIANRAANELDRHVGEDAAMVVLGMLHLLAAFSARGAKRPDDSVDRLDQAADIAERTGETTDLGYFFGPTNVNLWRIAMETDGGDPGRAVDIAQHTNPMVIPAVFRHVAYYTDTARALARIRRDREAIRFLLTAERMAPHWVRTAPLVRETARGLLDRAERRAGGSELRGLVERMGLVEV